MKPVVIVKVGDAPDVVQAARGDFDRFVIEGLGLDPSRLRVVDPRAGEVLPEPAQAAGVVVTGSSAMVTERLAWSEHTAAWLVRVVEAGTPLLGICYGHQLLAHALGGEVGKNPRGREIGSVDVTLTAAAEGDALFGALPATLRVQATHVQSVLRLPEGARLLGTGDHDPHQAFAVGERAWGVQFHPEFDAEIIRGYLTARREVVLSEGLDADALSEAASDLGHGRALLRRFAQLAG